MSLFPVEVVPRQLLQQGSEPKGSDLFPMPAENKIGEKVTDPGDPRRCQGANAYGQCKYIAVEGTNYCPRCGGTRIQKQNEKRAAIMYNLQVWRKRMDEMKGADESKSLKEEVAILRMTLEAALDKCKTTDDLFMMSSTISDLACKVEKVVRSCNQLEQSSGQLMDKSKAIAFAGLIVEVVDRVVMARITDTDLREKIVDDVSQGILAELQKSHNEPTSTT